MDVKVNPRRHLTGVFSVPGDKSISHRALLMGALAEGTTVIKGVSEGADVFSTIRCLVGLGVPIDRKRDRTEIAGRGLRGFRRPHEALNAGNSGTTIRLLSGILSGQSFSASITGDESLCRRPMKRIIDPLTRMGADIRGTTEFTPPLSIRGVDKLRAIRYEAAIASAQVKSAILLAGLFADGTTEVIERIPTRDHTERMLGLESVSQDGKSIIRVRGGMKIGAREFVVPGDFSSAAFLMVAGLLVANSEIMLRNVGVNPTRTKLLGLLREHGADITVLEQRIDGGEPTADIRVRTSALTGNIELEGSSVAELIDEIPILTVAWMFSDSLFSVRGAGELRVKESDRIKSLVANLRSLGIRTEDREDGFAFQGNREVIGGDAESFGDHRIAMAFGVAGLGSRQGVRVKGAECVSISYPEFWNVLQAS